ncbi:MAG: DUF4924 family protein [Flavobacteriales bacterium]
MIIALQKYQENVVEYLLYMWQIEDLIRASNFKLEPIYNTVIKAQAQKPEHLEVVSQWYQELIDAMIDEGVEQRGHLQQNNDLIVELTKLHHLLLNRLADHAYQEAYDKALPFMNEYREHTDNPSMSDVETCLHAMYSKLLMRLKKQELGKETEKAFDLFRSMLALLAKRFNEMRQGKLNYQYN